MNYIIHTTRPSFIIPSSDLDLVLPSDLTWLNPTSDQIADIESGKTYWTPTIVNGSSVGGSLDYPPVKIPKVISNWRAKAIIEINGLTSQVEAALAAMTGNAGVVARAAWNNNADLDRNGATVTALASSLGLTPEQVDQMFIDAASLEV